MKRTAQEVANVLASIYDERFGNDQFEQYRLTWADLRALAGAGKMKGGFLSEIKEGLEEHNYALVPFDTFMAVLAESDFDAARELSGRILERFLPDEEENIVSDVDDVETDYGQ